MSEVVHGNSKNSKKKQHLYEITDEDMPEDDTHKYGISGQALNKNGTSGRANSQVNQLNTELNYEKYSAEVLHDDIDSRQTALDLEKEYVKAYYEKFGKNPSANIRPKIRKND